MVELKALILIFDFNDDDERKNYLGKIQFNARFPQSLAKL
jgi:hypothetical protein